ncbi:MAG: thymidylate synthase [Candidatus Methanomethylicia archaeon]
MLPVIVVKGFNLPTVWEESIFRLWNSGVSSFKESYKYGVEKDSIKECSMLMIVEKPLEEPRVHLGYSGLSGLRKYVDAVINGSEDYLIGKTLTYTYHERHFNYTVPSLKPINQIEYIAKYLKSKPFSNRCISVTWKPWIDEDSSAPPCNIALWLKVVDGKLIMETFWRSRDAFNAAFANMYAFTELQRRIAEELNIEAGLYVDYSTSYHIYESDFNLVEQFLKTISYRRDKGEKIYVNSSFLNGFK